MTIGGAVSDLNNLLEADNIPFYYKPTIKKVIETIEQDAIELKTGYWIDVPIGQYVLLHRCSNCLQNSAMESKYCPDCGARMEDQNDKT